MAGSKLGRNLMNLLQIGVRFDEPVGKGDGTRNGTRYFDCEPKYGAFVRPHNLAVGDYPPAGLSDLEDSDDEL